MESSARSEVQYRVIDGRNRSGLFSVATILLENMLLRQPNEFFQVYLDRQYLYYDESWGPNVWTYYFRQPTVPKSFEFVIADPSTEWGFLFGRKLLLDVTNRTDSYESAVRTASQIFYESVGFSDRVKEAIAGLNIVDELSEQPTVAVHRRATDYKHTEILPIKHFFDAVDPYVDKGWQVFLATDSNYSLIAFKRRYGRRLHYLQTVRSWTRKSLHLDKRRRISPAEAGLHAVLDAYLLSCGNFLIRTRSNVTTFARILNPTLPCQELDQHLAVGSG